MDRIEKNSGLRVTGGTLVRNVLPQPREHEIRVTERDGRRWLQQWKAPPGGYTHERAWVDVGELPHLRASRKAADSILRRNGA